MGLQVRSHATRRATSVHSAIPAEVEPLAYKQFIATPAEIEQMLAKYDRKPRPPYIQIYQPSEVVNLQIDRMTKENRAKRAQKKP